MGHEAIIYGVIVGASRYPGEDTYRKLQHLNEDVIRSLPRADEWPWLDSSIFALPGPRPIGSYRRQAIHVGMTLKDDPKDQAWINNWIEKFEKVLTQLYWTSARIVIETDFTMRKEYYWVASADSVGDFEIPTPVKNWSRTEQNLPGDKL